MIFSKLVYKLPNGYNSTIKAIDSNKLKLFTFDNALREYEINLKPFTIKHISNSNYQKCYLLNNNHKCTCYDSSISVIGTEDE